MIRNRDTLYVMEAARDILWDDKENIPAPLFAWISQKYAPTTARRRLLLTRLHPL